MSQLIGPSLKNNETIKATQNRSFLFGSIEFLPLEHLYRWTEDNIMPKHME